MAATPTIFDHGSVTTSDTSEHDFCGTNPAVIGVWELYVDLHSLPAGASFNLRAYLHAKSGGSARKVYDVTVDDSNRTSDVWRCPPLVSMFAEANTIKWTYQQNSGATFTFDWAAVQL
jgi:hypothetical protein